MLINYYYNRLSSAEQRVYDTIKNALLTNQQSCNVLSSLFQGTAEGERENLVNKILTAVTLDNPDIIHYPGLTFSAPRVTDYSITFAFEYSEVDYSLYEIRLAELEGKIDRKLSPNSSDYLTCKIIFDEIASMVEYDHDVFNDYLRMQNQNPSRETVSTFMSERSIAFTPYGILTKKHGVCQGVAKLYKILCDRYNVQCACVQAQTNDRAACPHMLNVVEIDGRRGFVDVTCGLKSGTGTLNLIRYDYFLMPKRIYEKDFLVQEDFNCVDETLNFYKKNNVWFDKFEDLRRYLCAYTLCSTNGEFRCFYSGKEKSEKQFEDAVYELLLSHCPEGYTWNCSIRNGFCMGVMIDND